MTIRKLSNNIRKLLVIVSFIQLALSQLTSNQTKSGFNKLIWTYWDQGYDQMPFFTKLCLESKIKIGEQLGWKVIFIQKSTLSSYIEINQFERYVNTSIAHPTFKADIIRYLLLQKYGGMWMDSRTYFTRDLQWAQTLNIKFLQNKIGDMPSIILGAYTDFQPPGGNVTYVFDNKLNKTVNVFPRYENWFILSKPNNSFISDALSILLETFSKTKEVMDAQLIKSGILVDAVMSLPYFVASDYIFQITIQRKQKELQANNSSIKYAFQYYKICHIEGPQNIFKLQFLYSPYMIPMWADQTLYSLHQIDNQKEQYLFRKFSGWQIQKLQFLLLEYISMSCWGMGIIIQKESEVQNYLIKYSKGQRLIDQIYSMNSQTQSKTICSNYIHQRHSENYLQSHIKNIFIYVLVIMGLLFTLFDVLSRFQ